MKTATVRNLRNHFADVAKWIESGEQVTITRNGAAFATLAPAKAPQGRLGDTREAVQAGRAEADQGGNGNLLVGVARLARKSHTD